MSDILVVLKSAQKVKTFCTVHFPVSYFFPKLGGRANGAKAGIIYRMDIHKNTYVVEV